VQEAFDSLIALCRRRRDEWLKVVRIDLGTLHGRAGDWSRLMPWLDSEAEIAVLERLRVDLKPRLRLPVTPTSAPSRLRRALATLIEDIEYFNRRWQGFLAGLDLGTVNELRDGYNRYYLLEKECAVRSPRLARQGFQRLEPLTIADVAALVPLLPVPRMKGA
jgi:hypothetical protein